MKQNESRRGTAEAVVLDAPDSVYASLCSKINIMPVAEARPIEAFRDSDALSEASANERIARGLGAFLELVAKSSQPVERLDKSLLDFHIGQLDRQISSQLDAVMHAPEFQALEGRWRGLKMLVSRTDFRRNARIEVLDVSKEALQRDFEDTPELIQSGLYRLFDGTALAALAYTSRSAGWQFGTAEPLEAGALLIWGGNGPNGPIGELREEDGGVRLTEVAPVRTFCGGRAVVPNVYGNSLDVARRTLIAHGWRPLRPREKPEGWDAAAGLAKRGVIEAESCSGTGMGYCGFSYRNTSGVLGVMTVGGDPKPANNIVIYYSVNCHSK